MFKGYFSNNYVYLNIGDLSKIGIKCYVLLITNMLHFYMIWYHSIICYLYSCWICPNLVVYIIPCIEELKNIEVLYGVKELKRIEELCGAKELHGSEEL